MTDNDFGEELDEIIADFIVETEELIERLDQELVRLEETPEDLDLLNSIFRAAHTIKGTSSFLGFSRMTELTHKAENVLDKLRNGAFKVSSEIMDALLDALDGIKALLEEIREGRGQDGDYDPQPTMDILIEIADNNGVRASEAGAAAPVSSSEPAQTETTESEEAKDDLIVVAAGRNTAHIEKEGGNDLDALLSSAPKVEPKIEIPGEAVGGGDDLDALLSSAPKVEPKIEIPGEAVGGGDDLDALLSSAPKVEPKIEIPGESAAKEKAEASSQKPAAPAPQAASPKPAAQTPAKAKASAAGGKSGVAVEQTIRVDVERLDALMNLAGELVLGRNRLANITRTIEAADHEVTMMAELSHVVSAISQVTSNLQMAVLKTRMLPIGKVFNRFPRMVRDLAREKKKLVDLKIIGGNTEVDKSVIEAIGDPLVHLIRNGVDHGIEAPEKRKAAGKAEMGNLELSAQHEGNNVVIRIKDDGGGMDPEIISAVALKRGVVDEMQLARMSPKEIRMLIFQPGFSTAETITNTSGRGVGMDVVKTNVEQLGGTIDVESELGKGTSMSIKLPLTLASIQALMVKAQHEVYAISLTNVIETVRIPRSKMQSVEGRKVVHLRDSVIPVFILGELFDCIIKEGAETGSGPDAVEQPVYIVVIGLGEQRVGLVVDQLLGQEEVVIKSLGEYLQTVPGIAGSTILGDGEVALIIDVAGLMNMIHEMRSYVRV